MLCSLAGVIEVHGLPVGQHESHGLTGVAMTSVTMACMIVIVSLGGGRLCLHTGSWYSQ